MDIDWKLLGTAMGLVLLVEGLPYFLFTEKMPGVLRTLASLPPKALRLIGGVFMLIGLAVVWLTRL
jgi:hypothetical protein